jgi:sugar lactone lactonase YvrE
MNTGPRVHQLFADQVPPGLPNSAFRRSKVAMSIPPSGIEPPTEQTATAEMELAMLFEQRGDIEKSIAAYRRVLDRPGYERLGEAAFRLAELLKAQGDTAGAIEVFARALDFADSRYLPMCAINLGSLLSERGDFAGSAAANRRALESQHSEHAALAACNLGGDMQRLGDVHVAIAAYRLAMSYQEARQSSRAEASLEAIFGVGAPEVIDIPFRGDAQQVSKGAEVMPLAEVASWTLSMTDTLGSLGSGKTHTDGTMTLTADSGMRSDFTYRWYSRGTDAETFRRLARYGVSAIGPHLAARMLPRVLAGAGVWIGCVELTTAGLSYMPSGVGHKQMRTVPWSEYSHWTWTALGVDIHRKDPASGKTQRVVTVSRNTPNAYVLPALLGAVTTGMKNRPAVTSEAPAPATSPQPPTPARTSALVTLPFKGLKNPDSVSVNATGDVVVSETERAFGNRIQLLAGGTVSPVVLPFKGVKVPRSVAIDDAGDVYVADGRKTGRVWKLARGASIAVALPFGDVRPRQVAVDSHGNVYVTIWGDQRVLRLARDAEAPTWVPFTGTVIADALAVNGRGDVFIAGRGKLARMGAAAQLEELIDLGSQNFNVGGLAVNDRSEVFVADISNGRIIGLAAGSTTAEVLMRISGHISLATDETSALFIADAFKNRILKVMTR